MCAPPEFGDAEQPRAPMGWAPETDGGERYKAAKSEAYTVVLAVGEYHAFTNRSKKFHLFVSFRIDIETVFQ